MPVNGSVPAQHRSAIERKLHSKSCENGTKGNKAVNCNSAPSSPGALRRNKQPAVEPRYTKSTYLLIEAKKLAKEIEEEKRQESFILRPNSARTVNLGLKQKAGYGNVSKVFKKALTTDHPNARLHSPPRNGSRRRPKSSHISEFEIMQQVVIEGRLTPLRNSGRRKNFVVVPPTSGSSGSCEECGRHVTTGFYSEHRGYSYCNVPCYANLFSPVLGQVDGNDCSTLSEEQKVLRATLIPKLRTYNTYYIDKPCQVSCREINDKFVLEGIIKVYWGLQAPVTLADSDISMYWKNFQPEDGGNKENVVLPIHQNGDVPHKKISLTHKARNAIHSTKTRYKYKRKENNHEIPKKRMGCSACNELHENSEHKTYFTPPYGTPTTLRITNHVTASTLIDMLLKKFQVKDDRKRFTLYTVYESGGQRKLPDKSYPLLTRLNLGPCEDVARIFLLDAANHKDIPQEVAQYLKFGMPVLETFVQKFHEEEDREVEKIKDKYKDYRELLIQRMDELKESTVYMKEENV